MFELNLNLSFMNTSHALLNELFTASSTGNITDCTLEIPKRACGSVLFSIAQVLTIEWVTDQRIMQNPLGKL